MKSIRLECKAKQMVRFARHGINEVCVVERKSIVLHGTELSSPQSSSIREMDGDNILVITSLPQVASRFLAAENCK